ITPYAWRPMEPTDSRYSAEQLRERIASVSPWYHQIELAPGIVTPGVNDSAYTLARLDFPDDLSGKRAIDIGARDGFFSFELERRGAEVLAVDMMPREQTGFAVAADVLGSKVEYV